MALRLLVGMFSALTTFAWAQPGMVQNPVPVQVMNGAQVPVPVNVVREQQSPAMFHINLAGFSVTSDVAVAYPGAGRMFVLTYLGFRVASSVSGTPLTFASCSLNLTEQQPGSTVTTGLLTFGLDRANASGALFGSSNPVYIPLRENQQLGISCSGTPAAGNPLAWVASVVAAGYYMPAP